MRMQLWYAMQLLAAVAGSVLARQAKKCAGPGRRLAQLVDGAPALSCGLSISTQCGSFFQNCWSLRAKSASTPLHSRSSRSAYPSRSVACTQLGEGNRVSA